MKTLSAFVVASTLPLLSSIATAQTLPPIKEVVSFGDSLTDAGTYWFRFTSNPGLTFAQHLAVRYGRCPCQTSTWTATAMCIKESTACRGRAV
jgi:phospholipase/lecithinase/hemolysin